MRKPGAILCRASADPGHPNGKPCDGRAHALRDWGTDSAGRTRLQCICGGVEVPLLNQAYRNKRAYFAANPLEDRR